MRHDGRPIAETEELKLTDFTKKVTSIVYRDFSFVAIVKSILNFRAAFEKKHGVLFLATQVVDIVDDMVLSDILTGNSAKYNSAMSEQRRVPFNATVSSILLVLLTDWRRYPGLLVSHNSTMKNFSCPGKRKSRFWPVPRASGSEQRWSTVRTTLRLSTSAEGIFCATSRVFTRNLSQRAALSFLYSSTLPFLRTRLRLQIWNNFFLIKSASMSTTLATIQRSGERATSNNRSVWCGL